MAIKLSTKEFTVLQLLASGKTHEIIAEETGQSKYVSIGVVNSVRIKLVAADVVGAVRILPHKLWGVVCELNREVPVSKPKSKTGKVTQSRAFQIGAFLGQLVSPKVFKTPLPTAKAGGYTSNEILEAVRAGTQIELPESALNNLGKSLGLHFKDSPANAEVVRLEGQVTQQADYILKLEAMLRDAGRSSLLPLDQRSIG